MSGAVSVNGVSAATGEKSQGICRVDVGTAPIDVPLVVINGTRPGPRVAVTAGIHGGEYVSIPALRNVAMSLTPNDVAGSLVAVLVANTTAFFGRSVYYTPLDGLNLNRVFPGNAQGKPTERLARWLLDNVILPSDRYIDMHSGDLNEVLEPFVGLAAPVSPEVDAAALKMARAYGLKYIVEGGGQAPNGPAIAAARAASIPTMWTEVGGRGSWTADEVRQHEEGLLRALAAAGLLPDRDPSPPLVSEVISRKAWLQTSATGCWYPNVDLGDSVEEGRVLGEVKDFFGETLLVVTAPVTGMVFFLVTALAVNAGDPLMGLSY